MKNHKIKVSVTGLLLVLLAGCGSSDGTDTSSTSTAVTSTTLDPSLPLSNRVVLAGLLLEIGDVDSAVAAGLITPDDVEAAVEAIGAGTMATYLQSRSD
jgi:hypothetical protein